MSKGEILFGVASILVATTVVVILAQSALRATGIRDSHACPTPEPCQLTHMADHKCSLLPNPSGGVR